MADRHRPWSIHGTATEANDVNDPHQHWQRREATGESYVDALDLAEYTHQLQSRPLYDHYNHSLSLAPSSSPYSLSLPPSFVPSSELTSRSSITSQVLSLPPRLAPSFSAKSQHTTRSPPHIPHYDSEITNYPLFSRDWYAPSSAARNSKSPSVLPWNAPLGPLHSDYIAPLPDEVKEERMKMLEEEFGDKPTLSVNDVEVGSGPRVDEDGNLIMYGKKMRIAVRWAQGLLSLGAAISSLYAAFVRPPFHPFHPSFLLTYLA